ncbi:hypothetical protein HPB50_026528 [Hyalomma asiaticum]|uniref:Uncharacterized protein n=1 Tax=Hyalomma asiaticum TaxID=266040 RepID=A0ACB7SCM4_HYAAI|nr:hypothetical protein HPB50_026528 [Hyalomma asiaticum]
MLSLPWTGITNHDEFSLVRDLPDENKEPNTGTLTLRREKKDKDRDQKMEQLKKKLKTDDDLNWVDHSKTLRELGVDEDEMLTLRRKYFFSDSNVDSRDPVQLNLLYVQARDAILNTTHPVTLDEACKFAGLQCQIQFGDHNETKHKAGFLDLKEFLPKDYAKIKGIEKKIFAEHRKNIGTSELDAKVKYVALARSLKTYGVTFFLVKEKMKGKNKLVPRLLGVTKDSVMRLDERTKEIMKVWPLTTVRRWAASPNSFTLDFGDYSESYYSVQTTEGEQISQLIAGYIDIILKKKKAKDHLGIDGDEGSTMVEDSVSPAKAGFMCNAEALEDYEQSDPITNEALNNDYVWFGFVESNFVTATDTFQEFVDAGKLELAVCEEASEEASMGDAIVAAVHSSVEVATDDDLDREGDVDPTQEPYFPCQDVLEYLT